MPAHPFVDVMAGVDEEEEEEEDEEDEEEDEELREINDGKSLYFIREPKKLTICVLKTKTTMNVTKKRQAQRCTTTTIRTRPQNPTNDALSVIEKRSRKWSMIYPLLRPSPSPMTFQYLRSKQR